jgi:hypothetical protein
VVPAMVASMVPLPLIVVYLFLLLTGKHKKIKTEKDSSIVQTQLPTSETKISFMEEETAS